MYWFGESIKDDKSLLEVDWSSIPKKKRAFSQIKTEDILTLLDAFSKTWCEDQPHFIEAISGLTSESGFSEKETKNTLLLLKHILSRESLEKRIRGEFLKPEVLDTFIKLPGQKAKVRAVPTGVVLHVTAGNVFLSSIDSLIMGLVTKNISLLKVSGQNKFFPVFFAKKLQAFDSGKILSDKFAVLSWKGGDTEIESFIKTKVNTIIAWGGEEMISSYKNNLPHQVKLLDFGPKISTQVISKNGLENKNLSIVAQKIVDDIVPWNQGACASPQNLYLEEGVDESSLLEELHLAFEKAPSRGKLTDDEATEILKEKYRGYYSKFMENGELRSGPEHLIHLEANKFLRPSPLNRSLIVKRYKNIDDLYSCLGPFSYYLQSCSYLLGMTEKDSYLETLALAGMKRFAPLGTITWGMEGAPHDGRFVLRELVNFVGNEERSLDYGEEILEVQNSSTLKTHFEKTSHPAGYIFASGGTTGEPKYVHFSYEEFDFMSDMLADNFMRQGIRSGMTVANLFVAGNLWSSFLCVEKALEKIGVIQLPIGGMCSTENILLYIRKFKPDVVMGIPSMLVMNAEASLALDEKLNIPMVFYAGEALSHARKEFLRQCWSTTFFGSAGYASVDAGVIGYQCAHSKAGEHHLFSDFVKLNIIEEEAVVTSHVRSTMPIKNYRTGDKVEWIQGECPCGEKDPRFKLLGRIDNVIQIWSCRLLVNDVESIMQENGIMTYQLVITESREANLLREKLTIHFEKNKTDLDLDSFLLGLYNRSRDVKDTIKYNEFKKDIVLKGVGSGEIQRNARTGKISLVIDQRR